MMLWQFRMNSRYKRTLMLTEKYRVTKFEGMSKYSRYQALNVDEG